MSSTCSTLGNHQPPKKVTILQAKRAGTEEQPEVGILITTRNRREQLMEAVASAISQTVRAEVMVIDDGSTDGTSEMIRSDFPNVRLHRCDHSRGYIVQRNVGASLIRAPIIFSLDDDAMFTTKDIVAQTLTGFDNPSVGAVAIPFINVNQIDRRERQRAPSTGSAWAAPSFIGTAHALRKDVFLALGGYRESLFHQGEEGDYCLRMLSAGYLTRLGTSQPIHHFESPRRDFRRLDLYGRRNNVLFAWHYSPSILLPAHLAATSVNGVLHGVKTGRSLRMIEGLTMGYGAIWCERRERRPVSIGLYRLFRELVRREAIPMEELEQRLRPHVSPL